MRIGLTEQAIEFLIRRGWPMLPSRGSKKSPCVRWTQFQEQLPTENDLRSWHHQFQPSRWGVVTGRLAGIVVVDFDGNQGRALMECWRIDPHVRTGSGGFHFYVQHPGWKVPTLNAKSGKLSWPWPGVDVRGDGGFAVLLGRNKKGPYEHLRPLEPAPFDVLPGELRDFLKQHSNKGEGGSPGQAPVQTPAGGRVDSDRLVRKALEVASDTGRNNAGFWLACQLRDNGYNESEAKSNMWHYHSRVPATNMKGDREPYTVAEMMASLREAFSTSARAPWNGIGSVKRTSAPGSAAQNTGAPRGQVADAPDSLGIYVDHTGGPLVVHTGEPLYQAKYSRVPADVLDDPDLKSRDIRVYAALASRCFQTNVAHAGKRLLARIAGCSARLVLESLRRLQETGHIQKPPGRQHGQRGCYVLLSPIFGQKQRAGVEEIVSGPKGRFAVSVSKDRRTVWTPKCQFKQRPTK
jgi:Bifunctional DNA primase/polymerase, N-terminal